ncbi:hypothetical protein BC835DRAFT_817519 [Cytidiella melzeri]|nr:hypothetical protein BC835DRAFT_817519 [Cytidiella melzeri]
MRIVLPPCSLPCNHTQPLPECEEEDCEVQLTEQCTDQCVVVPCNDAHHNAVPAGPAYTTDFMCVDGTDCTALDNFLECCARMDYHHPQLAPSPVNTFEVPSPHSDPRITSQSQIDVGSAERLEVQQQHRCMWADCSATFASMNELVGHVNLQHLRIPSATLCPPSPPPHQTFHQLIQQNENPNANEQMDPYTIACQWADCRIYPTPSSIPGPSVGSQVNDIIGFLASHLMQDHLGLTGLASAHTSPDDSQGCDPLYSPSKARPARTRSPSLSREIPPPTPCPPTPASEHDCTSPSAHVCRWRGCGQTFSSCDALTAHITEKHVGGGKAHYECFWDGCKRNSEGAKAAEGDEKAEGGGGVGGFSSKQKICRHLQSHTGHRPFQCKICQQNFSEAATLAQHMRRHTQEKPYACDFPGCGKSFAITGALTIHKRTHNGHKPFKCTYCDRAFTESSNLSKHLRTHTGVRPYPCTEPGCTKTFARPDQLARHANVHRKKLVEQSTRDETDVDANGLKASKADATVNFKEKVKVG